MTEKEKNELKSIIWEVLVDFQNYNNRLGKLSYDPRMPPPPPGYTDPPNYVRK